jgi:iterative type I PKS product template protein
MSQTTTLPARPTTGKYLSASCQEIISEYFPSRTAARVVIRSNLTHPEILPSISQHLCNSVALTSSGHYADMAKVIGEYIWRCNRGPNAEAPGVRVGNMVVDHTYIIQVPPKPEGQWLEMEAILDVPEASSGDIIDGTVLCYFRSITPQGVKLQDLAHCTVGYDWLPGWLMTWSAHAEPIKNKMDRLYARAQTETSGEVQLMYKDKAYRLFKSFVDYGPKYQNMAEVVVDTKTLEAAARHDFQPDPRNDYCGPFYLDGSGHISGFVCNTADEDVAKNAYISHGFDEMKISPKFSPGKGADIRTYVHMQALPDDKTVLSGDVYVMQDGEVVGMWEGIKFKRIPRRVLNVFLPPPKK